jgi:integrase
MPPVVAAPPPPLASFHAGRPSRNKGMRYPADPPTVEEVIAVMRAAGDPRHGQRLRGLIVVLWRAGLRISEALALTEADLDPRRGAVLVRRGKGGRRREVGMDDWACEQLQPWLTARLELPVGPLFCVIIGLTRGRRWSGAAARAHLADTAAAAGVRRRFAPHQLRHAHAVELAHEGVPLVVIQRQLGHNNLGTTSVYLQGDRQRRNHRGRARPASADGPGPRRVRTLTAGACSSRKCDSEHDECATPLPLCPKRERLVRSESD